MYLDQYSPVLSGQELTKERAVDRDKLSLILKMTPSNVNQIGHNSGFHQAVIHLAGGQA